MGHEQLHPNQIEVPIQKSFAVDPVKFIGEIAGLDVTKIGFEDHLYMLGHNGKITHIKAVDLLTPRLTSAMVARQRLVLGSQASQAENPMLENSDLAPNRKLLFKLTHLWKNNEWEIKRHIAMRRPEDRRTPREVDEAYEKFDDIALLKLVSEIEEDNQEVRVRLPRTPQEIQQALGNAKAVLLLQGTPFGATGVAGVEIKQPHNIPGSLESALARLSISVPSEDILEDIAGVIFQNPLQWKNDLTTLEHMLGRYAKLLFDSQKQSFLSVSGERQIDQRIIDLMQQEAAASMTTPIKYLIQARSVKLVGELRFTPIRFEPDITFRQN